MELHESLLVGALEQAAQIAELAALGKVAQLEEVVGHVREHVAIERWSACTTPMPSAGSVRAAANDGATPVGPHLLAVHRTLSACDHQVLKQHFSIITGD